jgi:glycosyltransferase involved in cell wall biosynthesis
MRQRLGAGKDDFLLVHTGNMGAKQDLLNVVAAASLLKNDKHIKIALVGDGQERTNVAEAIAARHLVNVRLLPLQAGHEYAAVLTAADALLINQAPKIVDSVLPSKLLAYMASGRPVVAAAHSRSTTSELVSRAGCGVVADPGRPEVLAAAIRAMASRNAKREDLTAMGHSGRIYVEEYFDRRAILTRWDGLLDRLASKDAGQ